MYNSDMPSRAELPSAQKLLGSTVIALVTAIVLLVAVVLPAEYAVDPTGVGRLLNLTEMGEIKTQLAEEAAQDRAATAAAAVTAETAANAATQAATTETEVTSVAAEPVIEEAAPAEPAEPAPPQWRDEIQFTLTPGQGTEYKLTMDNGAVAVYEWVSDGGPINYDTHGDGNGNSISYEQGRGVPQDSGELEAAFTGNHGWFFRNRNDNNVTVTLRLRGDYGELKRLI